MTRPDYIFYLLSEETVGSKSLRAGDYLVSRQNAAELLSMTEAGDLCRFRGESRPFNPHADQYGMTTLFCRSGGFGDLLAMTPAIHEIKTRWPMAIIQVATHERHAPALENNPDIDEIMPWPVSKQTWELADAHVWLDQSIEKQANSRTTHFVDLVSQECGGIEVSDKRMRYHVSADEEVEALLNFPPKEATYCGRIGVQVHSNARNRTYPVKQLHQVLATLHGKGWEIFLFGAPSALRDADAPGVHVITDHKFRQSIAILATCDVVLAPDSAFAHVAGALSLPTVALYGPFPWQLRTAYNPSVQALQGRAPCAPCMHHFAKGKHFPEGCPTAAEGFCQALASIEPDRIVRKIEEAAQRG